jgi:hypothetical protein
MADQSITCPKCGAKIELTAAITHQIEEKLQAQFDGQAKQRGKEFEKALAAKDREVETRVAAAQAQLEAQAKKNAEDSVAVELRDLKEQLTEQSRKLGEARQQELDLRKKQRELQDREDNLKLELQRTLDTEREKIRRDSVARADEDHRLKDREKDKQLDDMRQQIEELKRKAEQGSQQAQGEVLELELEESLRGMFRYDEVVPVAKGKKGGDVVQTVKTNTGQSCGVILWESKRTKNWADGWVPKLKDDLRAAKADVAVIVTEMLPSGVKHIGQVDGVWVVDFASVAGLALALRQNLIEIAQARSALVGQKGKMEHLYNYLSGPEFRRRVEGIVEAFVNMKTDLDAERRAMEKNWAKREKQIERMMHNTAGMYGDMQGIVGQTLLPVQMLELPAGDAKAG